VGEVFAARGGEVTAIADDLTMFVGYVVDSLLDQHGVQATKETIEVPTLLRDARVGSSRRERQPRRRSRNFESAVMVVSDSDRTRTESSGVMRRDAFDGLNSSLRNVPISTVRDESSGGQGGTEPD
jgi:hypothetical protein